MQITDPHFTGREVSCRALAITFEQLEAKGLSPETLAANTGYSLDHLSNKHKRISWDGYCTFMTNASRVWTDDEYIAMGISVNQSASAKAFSLPARILYTAKDLYVMMTRPRTGVARQLFTCIDYSLEEHAPHHLIMDITMQDGYAPCREFFLITKGSLMGLPMLFGLPQARVVMATTEAGARYDIRIPEGGGMLAGLRRTLTWPFTAQATARELEEAYGALHTRYADLEAEISERQRVEKERERLIAELEAKNDELERFTYTVSHDLKSPLFTILGFTSILEKDLAAGSTADAFHNLARIREAAQSMEHLLNELLKLSRVGRVTNPPIEISLTTLAREAADLVAGRLAERGAELVIAPAMPVVLGDQDRLREVLQNLLDNAVKFMGDQPTPRIEVDAWREADAVVCCVRDNGIGIEPAYHDTVFDLFERLDENREGTGIGLALARRIVDIHGGRIWVASEGSGHGSTFYFSLPSRNTNHA